MALRDDAEALYMTAFELLDHYLEPDDGQEQSEILLIDHERRKQMTGLDTNTVLLWSKIISGSSAQRPIDDPVATAFLAGFDLALRVVEERMGIPVRGVTPTPDGRNRLRGGE